MKKYVCIIVLMFGCLILSGNIAVAQNTWTTGAYADNADMKSGILSVAGAASLTVTVTGETEKDYDFVYIYDSTGKEIKKLSGSISETFTVSGSSITARLTSDKNTTASGITVTVSAPSPSGLPKADYDSGWIYLEKGKRFDNQSHKLGVLPRLAVIWGAWDNKGTSMKILDMYKEWNGTANVAYGAWISKFTTTTYSIVGGDGGIMGHNESTNQNAYIRVYMWK